MAFTIYLHREQFQPGEPQILDTHLRKDTLFSFVDFVPSIVKRSSTSIISSAEIEYHSFRDMVAYANEWLDRNDQLELVNCESVRVLYKYNDTGNYYELRPNDVSHYVYGSEKNNILRVLRLWLRRRLDNGSRIDSPSTSTGQPSASGSSAPQSPPWNNEQASVSATDAGYESLKNLTPSHRTLRASTSSTGNAEISNEVEPIGSNVSANKQQQNFRQQQQNSQQQYQMTPVTSGGTGKLNRQQSLQRQQSVHQHNQSSPQLSRSNTISGNIPLCRTSSIPTRFHLLDYIDIIPELNETKARDSPTNQKQDKFERLQECVQKLNHLISNKEIRGQLLCVETVTGEASVDWKVTPEKTFTEFTSKNIFFLRCFFQPYLTPAANEQVGIIDFIPCHLSGGGFFKRPKFENFTQVLARATEWLAEYPQCTFKNAQSLDIKLKSQFSPVSGQLPDSRQMWFSEHGDYLKIFRIVYTITSNELLRTAELAFQAACEKHTINPTRRVRLSSVDSTHLDVGDQSSLALRPNKLLQPRPSSPNIGEISCVTGEKNLQDLRNKYGPWPTSSGNGKPIYLSSKIFLAQRKTQTIADLREQMQDWYNALEAEYRELYNQPGMQNLQRTRILAAETIQVYAKQEPGKGGELENVQRLGEQPFMYNRFGAKNGYLISVFRVYFDIGWFAWERLGYAQGFRQRRQLMRQLNAIAAESQEKQVTNKSPLFRQPSLVSQPSLSTSLNMDTISTLNSELELLGAAGEEHEETSFIADINEKEWNLETERSISELHGHEGPEDLIDTDSCVILTGGLSSLSLLANASDATFTTSALISRQSSLRRVIHRQASLVSTDNPSNNCCLF